MKDYRGRMESPGIVQKIGKSYFSCLVALGCLLASAGVNASDVRFSAVVDRNQISVDDAVELRLVISSSQNVRVGDPQFSAPEFDIVNEYNSMSVNSQYDSTTNTVSVQRQQHLIKLLKPKKAGRFKISKIRVEVDGKPVQAQDIAIQVVDTGTSPSRSKSQSQSQLPSQNLSEDSDPAPQEENVFIRTELDKKSAYKGEQIILSYYLYFQVKVFNFQMEKFPSLDGFLREDLDLPILTQRLVPEPVVINGKSYQRALLARYAAYPLQEGKLNIDTIGIRYNYYPNPRGEDPNQEDPIFNFFRQLAPRVGSARSNKVEINVLPLPQENKPSNFTGGVGTDFNVTSAVDKYEVRANEAVSLKVKVEGHGNIAALDLPKSKWPDQLEMFDSKGRFQAGPGGFGTKLFEIVLIPHKPGKVTVPGLEFGFFDPAKKEYFTKATEPFELNVLDPLPGGATSVPVPQNERTPDRSSPTSSIQPEAKVDEMRPLKMPSSSESTSASAILKGVYGCLILLCGFFIFCVVRNLIRKRSDVVRKGPNRKSSEKLSLLYSISRKMPSTGTWQEVTQAYDILSGMVLESIENSFEISARSLSRSELEQFLVEEKGLERSIWDRIARLFEFVDLVRFASSINGVSELTARTDLQKWVKEAEDLTDALDRSARRA